MGFRSVGFRSLGFGVFDERGFDESGFDENFLDEIDHFYPNFDESVPNRFASCHAGVWRPCLELVASYRLCASVTLNRLSTVGGMTGDVGEPCSNLRGGEQGDPLMPLLFAIGIQGALEEVAVSLEPGEQLCAFLDDVCALCLQQLGAEAWQPAGIKVLGTPIGGTDFVRERTRARIVDEQRLWDAIPRVPDLQCVAASPPKQIYAPTT